MKALTARPRLRDVLTLTETVDLANRHADVAHSGVFDSDCGKCVEFAAAFGIDLVGPRAVVA